MFAWMRKPTDIVAGSSFDHIEKLCLDARRLPYFGIDIFLTASAGFLPGALTETQLDCLSEEPPGSSATHRLFHHFAPDAHALFLSVLRRLCCFRFGEGSHSAAFQGV